MKLHSITTSASSLNQFLPTDSSRETFWQGIPITNRFWLTFADEDADGFPSQWKIIDYGWHRLLSFGTGARYLLTSQPNNIPAANEFGPQYFHCLGKNKFSRFEEDVQGVELEIEPWYE